MARRDIADAMRYVRVSSWRVNEELRSSEVVILLSEVVQVRHQ
jgi:hypothetical protein